MTPEELAREIRAHDAAIAQRDAAEQALSQAYEMVVGRTPEWSSTFDFKEALTDIAAALSAYGDQRAAEALEEAAKIVDHRYRYKDLAGAIRALSPAALPAQPAPAVPENWPLPKSPPEMISDYVAAAPAEAPAAEAISPSDPMVTIAGIRHFGLAADGSDLADLETAFQRLTASPPREAIAEIAAERQRQISEEGWTAEHDDQHVDGALAQAAGCYAVHASRWSSDQTYAQAPHPLDWPWAHKWWKPKNRRRDLIRAGALIVAEIERLDRAVAKEGSDNG